MAAGDLALAEEAARGAIEDIVHLDVIPDVAGIVRALAATHSHATVRWFVTKHPRDFVHAVHGLFHETIAAAPCEVVPVAHLPLDITPLCLAPVVRWHGFDGAGVVSGVHRLHITNGAIGNTLEKFAPTRLITPAKACHHR